MNKSKEKVKKKEDASTQNGIRIVENSFIKINNGLFKGDYEPLETTGIIDGDYKTYYAFTQTADNIINNVNQINYWSNSTISGVFVDALLIIMLNVNDKDKVIEMINKQNLITQINTSLSFLVSTFKDITIFKNYILALKTIYGIKYTDNIVDYIEKLQEQLVASFEVINEDADKVNALLGDEYLGKVDFNNNGYMDEFKRMQQKIKDLEFLGSPYPIIANEFYSKFNVNFIQGKAL